MAEENMVLKKPQASDILAPWTEHHDSHKSENTISICHLAYKELYPHSAVRIRHIFHLLD